MKIEQLIVQHLYNNKKVSLQEIGSFIVSPNVSMPGESDKDGIMPENAISFEYNTKAREDESLIDFIVQQTRKIRPLATSDLESYSILGREYLNIGKPFFIEGLGTLQKNQNGQYEFSQGNSVNPRLQAAPALLKEKNDEQISFSTPIRKPDSNKSAVIITVIILLLLAAATVIYFLNTKNKNAELADTPLADTSVISRDTPANVLRFTSTSDTSTFKAIVNKISLLADAQKEQSALSMKGHAVTLYTTDSLSYNLEIPFYKPLSDTSGIKDSLARLFGRSIMIRVKN